MHCGDCKYLGWLGLDKWCRHPAINKPILQWGKQCAQWIEFDSKPLPGQQPSWLAPVKLTEQLA